MSQNSNPLENAQDVIEAFGGIRPMAKKLGVAVTTVQGWKNRAAIPVARTAQILQAARDHDVDLGDAEIANENEAVGDTASDTASDTVRVEETVDLEEVIAATPDDSIEKPAEQPRAERAAPSPKTASGKVTNTTTIWIAVAVLLMLTIGLFAYMLLQPRQDYERIAALENELNTVQTELDETQEKQSFLGNLIPADLNDRISDLKTQAEQAQANVQATIEKTQIISKQISTDILADDAGTLEERAVKLGEHVQDLTGSTHLSAFMTKVEVLKGDTLGQNQITQSLSALQTILESANLSSNLQGALQGGDAQNAEPQSADFNQIIDHARQVDPDLAQTFAGVPQEDLKAAALLLGMGQFRSALNRDNAAFDGDLALLNKLVGENNPALSDALARLAPHARSGVLTPSGLSTEFRTLAGDAVVASLSGEDVSFSERASARFNDVFQVEKDGALVTGTETQATLTQTQNLLDQGDLASAVETVQTLDGDALGALAPWLSQANATLDAQHVQAEISKLMSQLTAGNLGAVTGGAAAGGAVGGNSVGGRLVQDKEAGINLYVPNSGASSTKSLGDIINRFDALNQQDQ